MIRWLLRKLGYFHIDYGFSTGRHWMSIDGHMVYQASGADCWMRDEDVHRLIYVTVDRGEHWSTPGCDCWLHSVGKDLQCQHPGYRFCEAATASSATTFRSKEG